MIHQHPNRIGIDKVVEKFENSDQVTIAGLGDSLTYGWMVQKGFFERFLDSIETRYPDPRILRINAGVPGDTAAGGASRLSQVLVKEPDLLIVQFALNDLFTGETPANFASNLTRIVKMGSEAGACVVLVTSCPVPSDDVQAAATRFYDAVRDTGRQTGVNVADLDRHWRDSIDSGMGRGPMYLSDGVHPSDAGHSLMAKGLLELFPAA